MEKTKLKMQQRSRQPNRERRVVLIGILYNIMFSSNKGDKCWCRMLIGGFTLETFFLLIDLFVKLSIPRFVVINLESRNLNLVLCKP